LRATEVHERTALQGDGIQGDGRLTGSAASATFRVTLVAVGELSVLRCLELGTGRSSRKTLTIVAWINSERRSQ
jgi:hypothetical protein